VSVRNLERLLRPASVALIVPAAVPGSIGAIAARNLGRARFTGDLMVVDPDDRRGGPPAYPNVASLPYPPDLALIGSPADAVPGLIRDLGERGTRAAVVLSSGFAVPRSAYAALQQAILDAAKPYLLRVVGPDSLGIMIPQLGLDASFSHLFPSAGNIAFLSQSGAIVTAMLDWAVPRGIGFSHVVCLGDKIDVDFGDMLDYLAGDTKAGAILIHLESLTNGRKFMSAARAAARSKPVLILKAGRTPPNADAAGCGCGALAGTDVVYDAAFRRAGVVRVETMAELFDAAETLAATREQIGERLAILTNSGGAGLLAADALAAAGGRGAVLSKDTLTALPAASAAIRGDYQPLDLGGGASGRDYAAALGLLILDREVDAVLVLHAPTVMADPEECARAVVETVQNAGAEALRGLNIFTAWLGQHSAQAARRLFATAGIATYETPDSAVAGFMHRVRHRHNRELLMEAPPAQTDPLVPDLHAARRAIGTAIAAGSTWLDAQAAAAVLAAYGISVAAVARPAATPDEAVKIAAEIGFPVALKITSPDIAGRGELGGVVLNLKGEEEVRGAAAAMLNTIAAKRPTARLDGFLVQPMAHRPGAAELVAGLVADPVFGPMVVFGSRGLTGDISDDCSLELPPLNALLARRLLARTRVSQRLQNYRGTSAADVDALVGMLIRLGRLAADLPEVQELDLDPLLADAEGVIVLDARLRVAPAAASGSARLAIAPYPEHLASTAWLHDGTAVALRPLRPEDESLLHDLAAHMSHEDLRLRFFTPVQGLTRAVAARLSQLDYDRELALIAVHDEVPLGVVHYFADPDNRRAEYAIAVRSDRKGMGLGYLLMTRLIEIARQRGIGEIDGEVLQENEPMLKMCRELGFRIAAQPADPGVMTVKKVLNNN
jgi:acetyltransferase